MDFLKHHAVCCVDLSYPGTEKAGYGLGGEGFSG